MNMSNEKITHYNLDPIDAKHALINLIWGEKSNGKSYQVKHKKAVIKYIKTQSRFILMRRFVEETSTEKIEQYFADVDVAKATDGQYNCITTYRKRLYLSFYDVDTCKTRRGPHIGYVVALSREQNYAGASYLDVEDIIFEEFMSRSIYLPNEPDKLMNFYNTVDRKRGVVRLWLVGNTISRICPYIQEWGLNKIISTQKQGEIIEKELGTGVYDNSGKEFTIKLAIEYCKASGQRALAIGKHKDMINKGSWQTDPQPKLPKSNKEYKVLFRFGFLYKSFKFLCEYLFDGVDTVWFIYPYKGEFKNNLIVFSDIIKPSQYWQRDIYNTEFNNERLNTLFRDFRESKIFYSSDMCGTDFKQAIDFTIRK